MNKEIDKARLATLDAQLEYQWASTEAAKRQLVVLAAYTGQTLLDIQRELGVEGGKGLYGGGKSPGLKVYLADQHPGIPYDTALKYMKIPEQFPEILENVNISITNLPLSSVMLLLGASDEVKQVVTEKLAAGEIPSRQKIQELNKKHKEELARTAEANKAAFIKTTNLYDVKLVDLNKQYQQTLKEKNALDQQVANLRNNTADPLHEPKVKTELAKLAAKIAQRDGELFKLNKEMTVQSVELEKAQEWIKNNAVIAQKYSKEISELKHTLGIAQKALHNAEVNAKIKSFGAAVDDLAKVADPNIKKAKLEIIRLQNQIESKESELKDISKNTDVQFVIQKLKAIELLTASSKPIEFYTNLIEQLS